MKKSLRGLSALLLILSLGGVTLLVALDALNQLRLTPLHQWMGALSFMLIGASYVSLQLSGNQPWRDRFKRILPGAGFFLWGSEQFLPSGPLVTIIDTLVVLIFVSDLALLITDGLGALQHSFPNSPCAYFIAA